MRSSASAPGGARSIAAPTNRRDHAGVVVHRFAGLLPSMMQSRKGLPMLRPALVLLDLATVLNADALAVALNKATSLSVVTLADIDAAIDLRRGHHGAGRLAAAATAAREDPGSGGTRSALEDLVLNLLRKLRGLPPYERNQLTAIGGGHFAQADILFPEQGVLLELDSRKWHEQRMAMDSDRRRDQRALAAGYITFRVTWRHAVNEWREV